MVHVPYHYHPRLFQTQLVGHLRACESQTRSRNFLGDALFNDPSSNIILLKILRQMTFHQTLNEPLQVTFD